jgi:hypothetical protein
MIDFESAKSAGARRFGLRALALGLGVRRLRVGLDFCDEGT